MNKIYSFPLVILLFSACSTKEVVPIEKKSITSPSIQKTTAKIVAIQPKQPKTKKIKVSPPAKIVTTPILTNNRVPQEIKGIQPVYQSISPEPQIIQQATMAQPTSEEMPMIESVVVAPTQTMVEQPSMHTQEIQPEQFNNIPSRQFQTVNNPVQTDFQEGIQGDFQGNYNLEKFIDRMVYEQGFDRNYLNQVFSQAQNTNNFIRPYTSRSSTYISGAWDRYKQNFIYEKNIQRGIAFWNKHRETLARAEAEYGVPAEYIVGIIGIETAYGVNFGKKKVIDVLTTKSMLPNRRNNFYTKQLEKFLIMTRKSNLNPNELMGSSAGAMGYGQFIASSYLDFAVDFNADGTIDLWNAEDAIGSIANYFSRNGWNRSIGQVAIRAKYKGNRFSRLKTGYKTKYSQYKLKKKYKIKPRTKMSYSGPVSLLKLNRAGHDELWFGTHNFRVITTYNHSSHYGMAVFQLAKEVQKRRGGYYSSL